MKQENLADVALFERIRYWKEFRREAGHLFPTDGALRWFIRCHESALVSAGALLKLRRGIYVDPGPFRAAAINLMRHAPQCETRCMIQRGGSHE